MVRRRVLSGLLSCISLLFLPCLQAAEADPIQDAVNRGVAYLQGLQNQNGTWPHGQIGATALCGLTLLECGVPADDPSVLKAALAIRLGSVQTTHTYSLSLAILFLDRLGEKMDVPLIESLAVRLLAGQKASGGWTYDCPPLSKGEKQRLLTLIQIRSELVARKDPSKNAPKNPPKNTAPPKDGRKLSKEIQEQLTLINLQAPGVDVTDNSNTQFATLALWVARRHRMPVDKALGRIDAHFRRTQNGDGGWGYFRFARVRGADPSTPAMTCAGLLGLAVGQGSLNAMRTQKAKDQKEAPPARDPANDPAVRNGLLALGTSIGHPAGSRDKLGKVSSLQNPTNSFYFLWSLERVAVAFDLATIGTKDWHTWGTEILLASQKPDGSWQGEYKIAGCDTCFALLFLRKANLAQDLSASLKGRVPDPGEATLRSGGVGGEALVKKGLPSGVGSDPKKEEKAPGNSTTQGPDAPLNTNKPEIQVDQLRKELVNASPASKQLELIDKYKAGKGAAYTRALAASIHELKDSIKERARDALAERLVRMTSATLRAQLDQEDAEIRSAAALAIAMKEDKSLIPALIDVLADKETRVAQAAHVALKALTNQDFGPEAGASAAERDAAVSAWKAWWLKQDKK